MRAFDELADELASVEARVNDVIFDAVRHQMRDGDEEAARDTERELAKVRRHLAKAIAILRHHEGVED